MILKSPYSQVKHSPSTSCPIWPCSGKEHYPFCHPSPSTLPYPKPHSSFRTCGKEKHQFNKP